MKIGIIGSGTVGQQLGNGLLKLGHQVRISTRDETKLVEWKNSAGENAASGSFQDAAIFGEVIVIATSWNGTINAINLAGIDNFSNKIVIDVTNPLDFSQGVPPRFSATLGNSGGEQIQKMLPDAQVVKAFNIISAYIMIDAPREEGVPDLFIAGNDNDAKTFVNDIAMKWGWGSVIDLGDISQSFFLETLAHLWIIYGFKNNNWTHAFKLLKK
jgi:predicted dinucleotide-binding enzyme